MPSIHCPSTCGAGFQWNLQRPLQWDSLKSLLIKNKSLLKLSPKTYRKAAILCQIIIFGHFWHLHTGNDEKLSKCSVFQHFTKIWFGLTCDDPESKVFDLFVRIYNEAEQLAHLCVSVSGLLWGCLRSDSFVSSLTLTPADIRAENVSLLFSFPVRLQFLLLSIVVHLTLDHVRTRTWLMIWAALIKLYFLIILLFHRKVLN